MAATLLDQPIDIPAVEPDDGRSITVTGPDGAEYRFGIPESATPTEVAAIAASVSATLSAEIDDLEATEPSETFDAWRVCSRLSATGRSVRSSRTDGWKLSGRPGLF